MVPFLDSAAINREVDKFLAAHHPNKVIPIPIEEIAERAFQLEVTPILGLLDDLGIDGFLSNDLKELFIDHNIYMNRPTRSRFTFAHELGHIWLHKSYVISKPTTEESWKEVKAQSTPDNRKMETQANMFAGQLLLPTSALAAEFAKEKNSVIQQLKDSGATSISDQSLAPYLAKSIAKTFEVSERCAQSRVTNWLSTGI